MLENQMELRPVHVQVLIEFLTAQESLLKRISSHDKEDATEALHLLVGEVRQFCQLQAEGQNLMRAAMSKLNLSARSYHCILNLVRSIADLAGARRSNPLIWRRLCSNSQN